MTPSPGRALFPRGEASGVRKIVRRRLLGYVGLLLLGYLAAGFVVERFERVQGVVEIVEGAVPIPAAGVVIRGVTSVHTGQSHDAVGTVADIVRAARRGRLDFVLIGDHPPLRDPYVPAIIDDSVLIAFGEEIKVDGVGRMHLIGMTRPLIAEDGRNGSDAFWRLLPEIQPTTVVVHGRIPKLRDHWFAGPENVTGWEVLDMSEAARRAGKSPWALYHIVSILTYGAFGILEDGLMRMDSDWFNRPAVAAFDSMSVHTPLTAMAGLNHHPKIELLGLPVPAYPAFFRTLVNNVVVTEPEMTGADRELATITEAIRGGRIFISVGAAEAAEGFRFAAVLPDSTYIPMGSAGAAKPGLRLATTRVRADGDPLLFRVFRDGLPVGNFRGAALDIPAELPGVYRVEVYRYSARLGDLYYNLRPWIFANPIRIVPASAPDPGEAAEY